MASVSPSTRADAAPAPRTRNNLVLGAIGGTFVGVVALTAPFVFMQLRSALPYMATPRSKVERALKFVSHRRKQTPANIAQQPLKANARLNFVDLGSGDGTTILSAASLGWNATGLELNPTLWFISYVRRLFSPKTVRTNSHLVLGDMFESAAAKKKLRGADCVMIFGVQSLMPKIADLVSRECRPGCYLMSYRFRVPLISIESPNTTQGSKDEVEKDKPDVESSGRIDATMIYDEEEMRVYELAKRYED